MTTELMPDKCNFRLTAAGLPYCTHPEGNASCTFADCPIIVNCPDCDDWRRIRSTFGYCVHFYGFRTSSDGCLKEAVS